MISVIIPVYNVEKYLADCLESVISQTIEELEIICVDDFSKDKSLKIIQKYIKKDNRISVHCHNKNKGLAATRNTAIAYATGEYLFFIDSDDLFFSKNSLETLVGIAIKDNADETIGGMLRWDEFSEERILGYHANYLKKPLSREKFEGNEYLKACVTSCNKLFKHSFIKKNNLHFNPKIKKFEDNPFSWKVHLLSNSISLTPKATYLHRQRLSGETKSIMQKKENDYYYHLLVAQDMHKFLSNNEQFNKIRFHIDQYYYQWLKNDLDEDDLDIYAKSENIKKIEIYAPAILNIPVESINRLPNKAQEIIALVKEGKYDDAYKKIINQKIKKENYNYKLKELEGELNNVYSSWSWRITKFLRIIKKKITCYLNIH